MFFQVEAAPAQRRYMRIWSVVHRCLARLTAMAMGFAGAPLRLLASDHHTLRLLQDCRSATEHNRLAGTHPT
jgi:hypothetical protein